MVQKQICVIQHFIGNGPYGISYYYYHQYTTITTIFSFWMWRPTLVRGVLFLMSAEYSAVMCGAWPRTLVTWQWLRLSMIYCCALRLWSQICVTCRKYWFPDSVALSCCAGARCLVRVMAAYVRDGYGAFRQPKFECSCFEMMAFRVCGVRQNFYVFSLYRNPDLDDRFLIV